MAARRVEDLGRGQAGSDLGDAPGHVEGVEGQTADERQHQADGEVDAGGPDQAPELGHMGDRPGDGQRDGDGEGAPGHPGHHLGQDGRGGRKRPGPDDRKGNPDGPGSVDREHRAPKRVPTGLG